MAGRRGRVSRLGRRLVRQRDGRGIQLAVQGRTRPQQGTLAGLDDLEIATVEYIDWYNNSRLHGKLEHVPPADHDALHTMTHPVAATLETR
ncbi:IS3 family transposase [Micromonospora sp. NPDC023737]|uniref:IS3 family transposase n=1 Tax=unclassified Micromonospora TaxID=2617518 RepID=UPI0033E9A8E4